MNNIEFDKTKFELTPILRGQDAIEILWHLVEKYNIVICGGYVRYCVTKDEKTVTLPGDIDLFPTDLQSFDGLIQELKRVGFIITHENDISVTFGKLERNEETIRLLAYGLWHENSVPDRGDLFYWFAAETFYNIAFNHFLPISLNIQVIKPIDEGKIKTVGSVEEIISNFDFTVTRAGLVSKTQALVDIDFHHDEENKKLVIKYITCPISSVLRCMKYAKKGYFLSITETLKLFFDWNNRGSEYQNDLYNRLEKINMDSADGKEVSKEELDHLESLLRVD